MSYQGISTENSNIYFHTTFILNSSFPHRLCLKNKRVHSVNNTVTFLDVIYKGNGVRAPTLMKNVVTEYIENMYNPTSQNTLSISGKVWDQTVVIMTTHNELTDRNIAWNNIFKNIILIK